MKSLLTQLTTFTAVALISSQATALTFKSGQAIASDGQVYDGISPQNQANILAHAAREPGEVETGIINGYFYMTLNGQFMSIAVSDLLAVSSDQRLDLIKEQFTSQTGTTLGSVNHNNVDDIHENENHIEDDLSENEQHELNESVEHALESKQHDLNESIEHALENEQHDLNESIEHALENEQHNLNESIEHVLNSTDHDEDDHDEEDDD